MKMRTGLFFILVLQILMLAAGCDEGHNGSRNATILDKTAATRR